MMGAKPPAAEKDKIILGKPLPFSVFGAEGQLLLAEGSVVENDRTRQMLLRKGVYRDTLESDAQSAPNGPPEVALTPLAALKLDYGATSVGRRFALNIASDDTDSAYNAWVIGVHADSIIVTAPRRTN